MGVMTENHVAASEDNPGVIALPPLLYAVTFFAVLVLRWLWPMPIMRLSVGLWFGVVLVVLGVGIAVWGRRVMHAAGTNVNPALPATTIVTGGPFRLCRNPLYGALTLIYIGLTLAFNTWWGIILLVPLFVIMHFGVVLREERYLEQKFGEAYRQYRSKVRRYL
jgi:protein-S-isoprenylcysteine O-methyltransferase Ste14